MKILLIQPPKAPKTIGGEDVFLYEPLALEYVAAGVKPDHDVRILDMRLEKGLSAALEGFQPQVVGITAYTVHVNVVRRLFDQIKQWNADVLTVVGGHHATVAPIDFLWPSIDLIVMGEGVEPFREIVRRSENGAGFGGIPGVTFAKDGCLVHADPQPIADLDAFPLPERRLTAQYRKDYFSEWMKPLATMRTSKGCPYRCSFCALWKLAGGRYLKRQPEKVVEELATLEEPFVFFADDESLVDAPRMRRLAELIKAAGIKKRYFLYGRSDTIARNPDLLAMWRDIGLERVFVGLEFCTDEDLQFINKGSTVERQRAGRQDSARSRHRAVRLVHRAAGVHPRGFRVLPAVLPKARAEFSDLRRADPAARHRLLRGCQGPDDHARLRLLRLHPHAAANAPAARRVL